MSLAAPTRAVALSRAGRAARRGDHRLSDRLHGLDESSRMVRLQPDAAALRRIRELRQDPLRRRPVPGGRGADHLLHHPGRGRRDGPRRRHGAALQPRVLGAGVAPHLGHPAHGGDAHRHRPGVRDDVQPDPGRGELSLVGRRPLAVPLDVLEPDGALRPGPGGRLAVDAADHAHRAGRAWPACPASPTRPPTSTGPRRCRRSGTSPCRSCGRPWWWRSCSGPSTR